MRNGWHLRQAYHVVARQIGSRLGRRGGTLLALAGLTLLAPRGGCATASPIPAAGGVSPAQHAVTRASANAALDLSRDPRLAAEVTLDVRSCALSQVLAVTGRTSGVPMTVEGDVATRRVTFLAKRLPLRRFMSALAAVTGLSWRAGDADNAIEGDVSALPPSYHLYRARAARQREQERVAASEQREVQSFDLKRRAMVAGIKRALAGQGGPGASSALIGVLRGFTSQEIDLAGDAAALPEGVISANNNSHLHDRVVGATPIAALPPALQTEIRATLTRLNPTQFTLPAADLADLARSQVAIVAQGGSVNLAVIDPEGTDVWVSPLDHVGQLPVPGAGSDSDQSPELLSALRQGELTSTAEIPRALWGRRLRFAEDLDRRSLPAVLASLQQQTGIAFLADDYLRSRQAIVSWVLTDRDDYPLDEALRQVAAAFGHRFVYRDGVMRVQTLTPGLDLRAEPPAELVEMLRQRAARKEPVSFDDQLAMGCLSDFQLLTLMTHRPPVVSQFGVLYAVYQSRAVLRFYGSLTPEQQSRALTAEGLPARDLDLRQHAVFTRLATIGLPRKPLAGTTLKAPGFYAIRAPADAKEEIVILRIVAEGASRRDVAYQFTAR
jgi:hypothetical protein